MLCHPPADRLRQMQAGRARWACGFAAAVLALASALGQSPPKAAAAPPANAIAYGVELAHNAGLPLSSAQHMRQDEAEILDLAAQVRSEVDHNPHDFLLVDVVRKAEQIRGLADHLKREIKLTSLRR